MPMGMSIEMASNVTLLYKEETKEMCIIIKYTRFSDRVLADIRVKPESAYDEIECWVVSTKSNDNKPPHRLVTYNLYKQQIIDRMQKDGFQMVGNNV